MKAATAVALVLLLSSVTTRVAIGQVSSLCVERAEDEGSVNIYPVQLKIDEKLSLMFLGGTKSCLPMTVGRHNIELSWPIFDWQRPDHGLSGKIRNNEFGFAIIKINKKTSMAICGIRSKGQVRWRIVSGDVKNCPSS